VGRQLKVEWVCIWSQLLYQALLKEVYSVKHMKTAETITLFIATFLSYTLSFCSISKEISISYCFTFRPEFYKFWCWVFTRLKQTNYLTGAEILDASHSMQCSYTYRKYSNSRGASKCVWEK
jgi:hypothetical protein